MRTFAGVLADLERDSLVITFGASWLLSGEKRLGGWKSCCEGWWLLPIHVLGLGWIPANMQTLARTNQSSPYTFASFPQLKLILGHFKRVLQKDWKAFEHLQALAVEWNKASYNGIGSQKIFRMTQISAWDITMKSLEM